METIERDQRAYRLLAADDAATDMRRVILGRLEKATERLRETDDDGDALAEAIHGARKDLKKARAAVRLIREELGEQFQRENHALRDAARLLAESRDAEVKLETLEDLVDGEPAMPPAATALWREALEGERDLIVGGEADAREEAIAAIDGVAARVADWKLHHRGWKLLAPGLETAYREGRADFEALPVSPAVAEVHDLRKRGKDLWYQVRLLRDAWEPVLGPTAEEIHEFTDLLGDHHDLAILAEDLETREQIDRTDKETLRPLIAAHQALVLTAALAAGERIYAEKPKPFGRRLRAYWRAWRRSA